MDRVLQGEVPVNRQAVGSVVFVMSFLFGLGLACLLLLRIIIAILARLFG